MRRLALLLLAALLAPLGVPAQPVSDSLLRDVGQFAGRYPNEVALCLTENEFHVPDTQVAVKSALRAKTCPDGMVAFWHTHPEKMLEGGKFRVFYRKHTGRWPKRPRDACYLSKQDVETAQTKREVPWHVVQVNEDIYCWWSADDIEAIETVQPMNPPPEGQVSWHDGG